jgi:hypothetical protein
MYLRLSEEANVKPRLSICLLQKNNPKYFVSRMNKYKIQTKAKRFLTL